MAIVRLFIELLAPTTLQSGMHLFLYQAARHAKSQWGSRRLSQSTIRNDFDLELLKRGIKGRYEIIGHGVHPFQAAMKAIGLEEEFYGHIIQIDDSKNAVWFKLNYDNIGRHVTKYIGGWKDLDAEHLVPHITQYQMLQQVHNKLTAHRGTIRNQFYYLNSFVDPRTPHHDLMTEAQVKGREYKDILSKADKKLAAEMKKTSDKMEDLQNQVRQYIGDHRG